MKVPVEGTTPGLRYGHTMAYYNPYVILFGGSGSGKNEILNDVWLLSTKYLTFKWEKVNVNGKYPISRVYHTATSFKVAGYPEMMVIYGGRDKDNNCISDISGLKKDDKDGWEWVDFSDSFKNYDVIPQGKHLHSASFFGPFLFVVGGRVSQKEYPTFDVYSMNKKKWYRFGFIPLFRHSTFVYYNIISQSKYEVYLYIHGGTDADNNAQINPYLYRINVIDLFSDDESLINELNDHISMLLLLKKQKKEQEQKIIKTVTNEDDKIFVMNDRVVVYDINDIKKDSTDLSNIIRQLSLLKLQDEGKKISENINNNIQISKNKYTYDESLVREFLQLLPMPENSIILTKNDRPLTFNKELISNLLIQAKTVLESQPTLLKLKHPIKIFGSINGQYNDLLRYFNFWGRPSEYKGDIESVEYLFLGNIVNRGGFSLEVLCLLLTLKVN
jgi:protein phosphatase